MKQSQENVSDRRGREKEFLFRAESHNVWSSLNVIIGDPSVMNNGKNCLLEMKQNHFYF